MRNNGPTFYVIAFPNGERKQKHQEILEYHFKPYKLGTGKYEGTVEDCAIVFDSTGDKLQGLLELAASWKQECILEVDPARVASLVYSDGTRSRIGTWKAIKNTKTLPPCYTECDGVYYYAS